jgi:SAM-dependent methyltransferase
MWDDWSAKKNIWTQPISHEDFLHARQEELKLLLTPLKVVPQTWFQGLGKKVLGLASGGGQQGAILSAHGYVVTIMDNSQRQLQADQQVAEREGYAIELVKADMTKPFPFEDESFDWIFNPVSNCYIEDLHNMWQEAYRVLRPGGAMMTGFTNPIVYMFADEDTRPEATTPLACKFRLPYNGRRLEAEGRIVTHEEGYQFSHTLEAQLGGQLQAGFLIKDLYEDRQPDDRLAEFTNLYIADLAVKL